MWYNRLTRLTLLDHVREIGHTRKDPRARFLKQTRGRETRAPKDRHAHLDVSMHPMTRSSMIAHHATKPPWTAPHAGKVGRSPVLGMTLHMREIGIVRNLPKKPVEIL